MFTNDETNNENKIQKERDMLDGTYLSRNFATLGPLPDSRRVIEFTRRRAGGWWNSREHLLREVDGVRKEKERLTAAQRISGWNESASEREVMMLLVNPWLKARRG